MARADRRWFLQSSFGAGAALLLGSRRARGANDAIRLAVCGLNGRGGDHIKEFSKLPDVRITHLVDPDTRTFAKRQKQLSDLKKPEAECVQDVRRVLESKDVDAITIATPNHWHSLMTIWACQAGKDVYAEKPLSHCLSEGRVAVNAARKYGRIVQHGTQRRSWRNYQNLAEVVRRKVYGPLRIAHGIVYKLRPSIGQKPVSEVPGEIDFDLWTGPAPKTEFHTNLVHYNWHWFWDFGNGDIGNQGVHQMDVARWMIEGATLPRSVVSMGGRFGYTDQGETPNTQLSVFDFGGPLLLFEVRGLPTPPYPGDNDGSVLHFDDGYISGNKFFAKGPSTGEPLPKLDPPESKLPQSTNIFANFIACMQSRKAEELVAPVIEGHYSSALCHLANTSYRVGAEAGFHPRPEVPAGECAETLERMEQHLARMAGLNPETAKLRVGRKLAIDAESERVTNDPAAAVLLTRANRPPYVVNEKV
ncbi:MAG: Gfo/Idh/MocA family oxidoreductase [Gemmataceae bacterium]|nr:Gfo/Idh/MocA family oxidoreductase [Gemmataceae bacterium]